MKRISLKFLRRFAPDICPEPTPLSDKPSIEVAGRHNVISNHLSLKDDLQPATAQTRTGINFQPGAILHEAIIGAFRANGSNFDQWCHANNVKPTSARQATFGQSRGPSGQDLLARMIAAAGPDFVRHVYESRMLAHADELRKGAA